MSTLLCITLHTYSSMRTRGTTYKNSLVKRLSSCTTNHIKNITQNVARTTILKRSATERIPRNNHTALRPEILHFPESMFRPL